jgi:hypothetical protein
MCPSYLGTNEEKHSTRGRARLLFEMLRGDSFIDGFASDEVEDALDLCLACKGCKHDCPVQVDMATYKSEFRARYFEEKRRPRAAALCDAFQIPLSSHCGPSAHLAVACAAPRLRHMEWFHDHVRIEQMLLDGAPKLEDGHIAPDLSRPGNGLTFRHQDAEKFEARG